MSLPPLPKELAAFAETQARHCALMGMMQAYGQQCREAGLEEAAKRCEHSIDVEKMSGWEASRLLKAADYIRELK